MIAPHRGFIILAILLGVVVSCSSIAQPTLPDLTGEDQSGLALLSWTCQYDGVKSISVLRSADSNFNYSTIGYVKKLNKGVQAFVDGRPMAGKNFYKLFIVFNSGLTWRSNHYGVYVDSSSINPKRIVPSNEALQKLIVTEDLNKASKTDTKNPQKTTAPLDKEKYTEVLKKGMDEINDTTIKRPKFKFNADDEPDINDVLATIPQETRSKLTISYSDDTGEIDPSAYLEGPKGTQQQTASEPKKAETKKKISITFDDEEDVSTFIETLPKSADRKLTISYNEDTEDVNAANYIDQGNKKSTLSKINAQQPKKISVTFKDDQAAQAYMESLPKTARNKITVSYNLDTNFIKPKIPVPAAPKPSEAPKPKISIKLADDFSTSASDEIKSKYISVDMVSGHVKVSLPDDFATHNYVVRFFDKDNHAVIEIPKVNTQVFILDRRNFQKKGKYKFIIRKDVIEFESGNITLY